MNMLILDNVNTGYGASQVLFDLSLRVNAGECVSLMGRNGMGKTTTVRAIMGQLPLQTGQIQRFGKNNPAIESFEIARQGIGLVPEGRQIFPNLTVAENLRTFYRPSPHDTVEEWTFDSVVDLFPSLKERLDYSGDHLSGGEQQMLAIGRALITNPKLLVLDEATEGLAPLVRRQIWDCLKQLKQKGQSILIIDKDIIALTKLANRHYILDKGRIAWQGNSAALLAEPETINKYLGI
jgi:branched-chain amino acid transport system ATP-binding protein